MLVLYTVLPAMLFIIGFIILCLYCKVQARRNAVKNSLETDVTNQTLAVEQPSTTAVVTKEQIMRSEFQLPDENINAD